MAKYCTNQKWMWSSLVKISKLGGEIRKGNLTFNIKCDTIIFKMEEKNGENKNNSTVREL